ncbi:transcription factor IIF subunit tfg1 [Spiromyces aspiralis]|uniref:Transcription factor IIF subunit tfg1 n=1 Tax=Spiromyces aspiralis TaxID=68401 RepID=A0ACC1HUY9_9FUNG|nr:transcription factor IIF subunit tfg1 [Spiromyces aspiralis]
MSANNANKGRRQVSLFVKKSSRNRPQPRPQVPRAPSAAQIPLHSIQSASGSVATAEQGKQPISEYNDYRLVSSKRTRIDNIMRLISDKPVDMSTFTPPLRLRRRERGVTDQSIADSAAAAAAAAATAAAESGSSEIDGIQGNSNNNQQQQQQQQQPTRKSGRGVMSKADTSKIAPYGGATRHKQMLFKKRTKQVFFADEQQRRLNIEESRPWIFEDYDAQNSWTGTLEGGQKSNYFLFVLIEDGFKVVPVHRWYNFRPKLKYRTLSIEEAEEEFNKTNKGTKKEQTARWLMKAKAKEGDDTAEGPAEAKPRDSEHDTKPSLVEYAEDYDDFGGGGGDEEQDSKARVRRSRERNSKRGDADEMDYEEVFDDDEEMPEDLFAGEEPEATETKPSTAMLGLGNSDEEEEEEGEEEGDKLGATGKEMKKLMYTLDNNKAYESDSDENPYLELSETEETEEGLSEFEETDREAQSTAGGYGSGSEATKPAPSDKEGLAAGGNLAMAASPHMSPVAASPVSSTASKQSASPQMAAGATSKSVAKRKRPASIIQGRDGSSKKTAKTKKKPGKKVGGSDGSGSGGGMITEQEVIQFMRRAAPLSVNEMLQEFKSRLTSGTSKDEFLRIVRKVGKSANGMLVLKDAYR